MEQEKILDVIGLQQLITDRIQESLYLDFKRGDSLSTQGKQKSELVKDVTAFANADGGRLIYGIAEDKHDGSAAELAPVTASDVVKRHRELPL